MKANTTLRRLLAGALSVAVMTAAFAAQGGDIKGTILKKDGGRLSGVLRYLPASKEYVVTSRDISLRVGLDQVQAVQVVPPPELEAAIRAVQAGQYAAAIPKLEAIAKDYRMMQYDAVAARWLAQAYLKMGQASKAVEMCEQVIAGNPDAGATGDMAPVYWQALLEAGRDATLQKQLGRAVEIGDRAAAARAQMMRGDMEVKNGHRKEALIDGYLRTAVMFQDVKAVQPEALYKAAECFDQLEQHPHAEKMRRKLLAEYPNDAYSKKLRSAAPGT